MGHQSFETSGFVLMLTQRTFPHLLVNLMTEQRRHNLINKMPQQLFRAALAGWSRRAAQQSRQGPLSLTENERLTLLLFIIG